MPLRRRMGCAASREDEPFLLDNTGIFLPALFKIRRSAINYLNERLFLMFHLLLETFWQIPDTALREDKCGERV